MSPTSCHCSTPRYNGAHRFGRQADLRCARDGLASHAVARAVLSGAGAGHDPVRDGSGWFDAALGHAHTSTPLAVLREHLLVPVLVLTLTRTADSCRPPSTRTPPRLDRFVESSPPSTMSTASLRSVTRRPRAASLPGVLPGVLLLSNEKAHLGAGFPLRCCQRLSLPNVATQHCRFSDNWHTSGSSSPVLSY
jgi:hypothetical protein